MPKNKGKGGKNRRRGKNENDNEKRELTFKEDGQEYAQVVKMLGYVFFSLNASIAFFKSSRRVAFRRRRRVQRLIAGQQSAGATSHLSAISQLVSRYMFC